MKLTSEQIFTSKMLVKKFKDRIYTKNGRINLTIAKQIALASGLIKPEIYYDRTFGYLNVNFAVRDPYGSRVGEVRSLYTFCLWIMSRNG